jgi:hypothetical protein
VHPTAFVQADSSIMPQTPTDDTRLELLYQENNLLTKQNAQLDKELVCLHHEKEDLSKRLLQSSEHCNAISGRLEAKEAEGQELSHS